MTVPRIGITGVVRTWDGSERTGVNAAYVRAVLAAGGVPVILSPLVGVRYAATVVDGIDGLLLTGGEDIDPALYEALPSPRLHTVSRERDLFELALFTTARARAVPILGVCRGIQLIAVGLGGMLYQDLPTERPSDIRHDGGSDRSERTHGVRLEPGSRAAEALRATSLRVNSLHHQAVKNLPPAVRATGWADDGVIEAIETGPHDSWLLAVQWHPEEMHAERQAPDGGLFRALVDEASRAPHPAPSVGAEVAERAIG
jgi:putative glutamine amidotransferase